jgi:acetyltransferase-like isoleucine patch superfamily enzyme
MAHGLFDFVILLVFIILVGIPSAIVATVYPHLSQVPMFLGIPLLVVVFICSFLVNLALISRLVPKPKPGKYPFPFHKQSVYWGFHFAVQRIAMFALWRNFFMSFNTLKFLFLRALGADIEFRTWISSDIDLAEVYLLSVKENALLGGRADLGCHFIRDNQLILAPIRVEEDAQVLIDVKIGPDCVVGKKSVIGVGSTLAYKVKIGESSSIGGFCLLQTHITIGSHVKIGEFVHIESAVSIEDGVHIPSGTWIRRGVKVRKDTKFDGSRLQTIERFTRHPNPSTTQIMQEAPYLQA